MGSHDTGDDNGGIVWGLRRTYSYLCVLIAGVASLAVWLVLTTYEPFPPLLFPDTTIGLLYVAVSVLPVPILYAVNRGLVPTYLLSLGPVVAKYAYARNVYTRVSFDFTFEGFILEILLTATSYWAVGLAMWAAAHLLGDALGMVYGWFRRSST